MGTVPIFVSPFSIHFPFSGYLTPHEVFVLELDVVAFQTRI